MNIHYFAAARQARGVSMERVDVVFSTVGELVDWLGSQHNGTTQAGSNLADVLDKCSFLIDGHHANRDTSLPSDCRVDILPPFAGG